MVKKRGANQHTGKPFIEWCAENGERGERLANEFREELPTELTKGSHYKAKWKCLKCKHVWRAMVHSRTTSVSGCPKCANRMPLSKTKNFLAWCEKNGELGKKLSREYVDKDKPPTAVTYASKYRAKWKCGTCSHEWRARMDHRTKSDKPSGCPECKTP
jgi:Zn finger protein HypA/HybF involved in hydrogenase expression